MMKRNPVEGESNFTSNRQIISWMHCSLYDIIATLYIPTNITKYIRCTWQLDKNWIETKSIVLANYTYTLCRWTLAVSLCYILPIALFRVKKKVVGRPLSCRLFAFSRNPNRSLNVPRWQYRWRTDTDMDLVESFGNLTFVKWNVFLDSILLMLTTKSVQCTDSACDCRTICIALQYKEMREIRGELTISDFLSEFSNFPKKKLCENF